MSEPIRLPNGWKPRLYQEAVWRYLAGGGRHAVVIAHRRWGKDDVALHHTACAAHERVANYVHMLPEYEQARKAIWEATNPHTGKRRIDEAFPEALRAVTRNDEMFIRFKNGSSWQVAGSDNYNKIVGASFAGIVYSEYAISSPNAQSFFTPMLIENGGWEMAITTPRGKNHAHSMYQHGKAMQALGKDWYAELAPASKTGALSADLLASELLRLQALHGDEYGLAHWEQEYECSFDAATPGAIFADSIRRMETEGRLSAVPLLEGVPVHTGWDLGRTDDTVIWWFQMFAGEPRIVDVHASNGKDVSFYANVLAAKRKERGFEYGVNYLPHDARPRTLAASRSILQQFDDCNREMKGKLGTFQIAPRLDKQEQIQALRATLNVAWVDGERCAKGIEALRSYHREWDDEKRVFKDSPEHDWSSHWCFTGDTEVLTRNGTYRIMDLPISGEVLTQCGWKRYVNPRITRTDARLVEVKFSDGLTVRCTPDHAFKTESGWKSAGSLIQGSRIQSGLTHSRSISMAAFTGLGRASGTFLAGARNCIAKFGGWLSETSLPDAISITGIQTQTTIGSRILSAFLPRNTSERLGKIGSKGVIFRLLEKKPDSRLLNGIDLQKGFFGTVGTRKGCEQSPSAWKKTALSVGRLSSRLTAFAGKLLCTAKNDAEPLRIERVSELSETLDVWCLTVPDAQEFCLSNGAVVHNCDAAMSLAVAWKRGLVPRSDKGASAQTPDGRSIGPGLTFGERKRDHFRKRKLERQGMFG